MKEVVDEFEESSERIKKELLYDKTCEILKILIGLKVGDSVSILGFCLVEMVKALNKANPAENPKKILENIHKRIDLIFAYSLDEPEKPNFLDKIQGILGIKK